MKFSTPIWPQAGAASMRRIATVFVVALLVGVVATFSWLLLGDRRLPQAPTSLEVAPGASVHSIAEQLAESDVISSARILEFYLRVKMPSVTIQAAEYDFPAHATIPQIASVLAAGGHAAQVWITVPEGFTAAQIANRLAQHGVDAAPSFLAVARETDLTVDRWHTQGLEGYLYPDTYLVPLHGSAQQIATLMTNQFLRNLPAGASGIAHHLRFSIPQIVTIASMVEREAKIDAERGTIAGVIYNRLRLGMPLEIDATIEYALPHHKPELSYRDLAVESPYNTYRHKGLPPTPIANPGKKSLLAAFHPAKVDYLYYVYRGKGRHQFSRTLEEQQAAEQKYLH